MLAIRLDTKPSERQIYKSENMVIENETTWNNIKKPLDTMDGPLHSHLIHAEELGIRPVSPPRTPETQQTPV